MNYSVSISILFFFFSLYGYGMECNTADAVIHALEVPRLAGRSLASGRLAPGEESILTRDENAAETLLNHSASFSLFIAMLEEGFTMPSFNTYSWRMLDPPSSTGVQLEHFIHIGYPYFWGTDSEGQFLIAVLFDVSYTSVCLEDHVCNLGGAYILHSPTEETRNEKASIVVFYKPGFRDESDWIAIGKGGKFFRGEMHDFDLLATLIREQMVKCKQMGSFKNCALRLTTLRNTKEARESKKEK